jgi:hypothetical protein
MTTRLASLPAPEGLAPALSGAAERSPANTIDFDTTAELMQ